MQRKKNNQYLVDMMPGRAQMLVSPMNGRVARTIGNIENFATNPKALKEIFDNLVEVVDPGPYYSKCFEKKPWNWDNLLSWDLQVLLVAMRCATYGPVWKTDRVCHCGTEKVQTRWVHTLLLHNLEIKTVSMEFLESMLSRDNTLETDIFGYTVKFTNAANPTLLVEVSPTATDMEKWAATIANQVTFVDSYVDDEHIGSDPRLIAEWALDLEIGSLFAFNEELTRISEYGGIQQTVEIECPACQRRYKELLPFGDLNQNASPGVGENQKYLQGLRKCHGSSLFQSLKQLEKSTRT